MARPKFSSHHFRAEDNMHTDSNIFLAKFLLVLTKLCILRLRFLVLVLVPSFFSVAIVSRVLVF